MADVKNNDARGLSKDFLNRLYRLEKKLEIGEENKSTVVNYINTNDICDRFNICPSAWNALLKKDNSISSASPHYSNTEKLYNFKDIYDFAEKHKLGHFSFKHARDFIMRKRT